MGVLRWHRTSAVTFLGKRSWAEDQLQLIKRAEITLNVIYSLLERGGQYVGITRVTDGRKAEETLLITEFKKNIYIYS